MSDYIDGALYRDRATGIEFTARVDEAGVAWAAVGGDGNGLVRLTDEVADRVETSPDTRLPEEGQ